MAIVSRSQRIFLKAISSPDLESLFMMDPDDRPLGVTTISHPCEPDYPASPLSIPRQKLIEDVMPPFSFLGFFASNGAAIRRQRAHQKALKDRWTTPDLRPLAEPPYIEWPETIDDLLPSDKRHRILFPHDAEKRARMKDLTGEKCAFAEYFAFLEGIIVEERKYPLRQMFWKGLIEEVFVDEQGVINEAQIGRASCRERVSRLV